MIMFDIVLHKNINFKTYITIFFGIFLISILVFAPSISTTEAERDFIIPSWIKNNAGWWVDGQIDDNSFVSGVEWLISNDIIEVPPTTISGTTETTIPSWVKNTSGWWADNQISDDDFVNAIQYLIKVGIMTVSRTENVITDTSMVKPSSNILDTTSFFEVEADHISEKDREFPELYNINSEGFRGPEFMKNKPDNTYRIIAVGDSTTFGTGVTDENTWPTILEKKLQNLSKSKNIEVINAASGIAMSFKQSKLIKEKLIDYEPDLIIAFGGQSDVICKMPEQITKDHIESKEVKTKLCGIYSPDSYDKIYAERWSEICRVGEKNGFDAVFILQPVPSFDKILSDQEFNNYFLRPEHTVYLNSLESFAQQIDNIEKHCVAAADFRGVFDYYLEPLYWDPVHVGDRGNEIIANKVLELISPILDKEGIIKQVPVQFNIIKPSKDPEIILRLYEANWGELLTNQKSFVGQNLSGKDFSNSNLENKIFFGSDLMGANFENSILSGSDFSLANLKNANFKNAVIDGIKLRQTTLDLTNFSNVDFSKVNLANVDLTNAILKNSNLSNQDLTKTFLYKSDLSGANLSNSNLSVLYLGDTVLKDTNLTKALLYEADLSLALNKDLSGTILNDAQITHSNLVGIDFSEKDLTGVNFHQSDLTDQDFTNNVTFFGNDFVKTKLSNANFEGVDLSAKKTLFTIFKNKAYLKNLGIEKIITDLFGQVNYVLIVSMEVRGNDLAIEYIVINNFSSANLENANFKNSDLKVVNFQSANLTNADLSGADLRNALLGGADLSNANLDGALLDGAILTCKNHSVCN
jgi:uncharacterized protein YjbI with pentapeptide repeats/lysophospholipase L1-like esterase|tara:strand:- start:46 stop:2475 length:2430 start_codon:yes stop_codon:yes gene_type:complete